MKKLLYLLLIMLFCLVLIACNGVEPNDIGAGNDDELIKNSNTNNTTDIDKQNYKVENDNSSVESIETSTCMTQQCNCCKNNSYMAILIAQTHFFESVNTKTDFGWYYLFEIIQEPNIFVEKIEDEYWYIMPVLYQNGQEALIDGECQYVYVIKKSTGEISDLLIFAGE